MQQKMIVRVISITKYRMDNNEGSILFVEQKSENPEILGSEIMKISAPYGLWDAAKAAGYKEPCECELICELRRSAGMKMAFFCTALNLPQPDQSLSQPDQKKSSLFNKP